jgi:di/tricarboxylate transporter
LEAENAMTFEAAAVFLILAVASVFFVTGWVSMDVVALSVVGLLAITGLVSPAEALSGFSNPAVVTIWALLILSGGLARTGVAGMIGRRLLGLAQDGERRLLTILMATVGILSAFMNNIAVAALFLPVVIDVSRRTKRLPSKLLIPLSYASLMGGLMTLVGTPPNIVISEALREAGLRPFQMFDFMPLGIAVLIAGTMFMALFGGRLLPERDIKAGVTGGSESTYRDLYDLQERMVLLHLPEGSKLHDKTLLESRLGSALGLTVIAVFRNGETELAPERSYRLQSGDRIWVKGRLEDLNALHEHDYLVLEEENLPIERLDSEETDLVEVSLPGDSPYLGRTLRQTGFRNALGVVVLAVRRGDGRVIRTGLEDVSLQPRDTLLVQGQRGQIDLLRGRPDVEVSRPHSVEIYDLQKRLMVVRVPEDSALAGKTLIESRLGDAIGLGVVGIIRDGQTHMLPDPREPLLVGDTLLVKGHEGDLTTVKGLQSLEIESERPPTLEELESDRVGLVEAVLSPHTTLAGRSLRDLNFRAKFGLSVLAIWRDGRAYRSNLRDMPLRLGDALLVYGPRDRIAMLGREPDFLVLTESAQEPPRSSKALLAILVMALALIPVILGWIPIAISAVAGVALMILTGCLTMEEAYRYVEWKAIFLIAGMLPLGIAMERTGAAQLIADGIVAAVGPLGPLALLAGFFLLAAGASQVMPNPAVAVLLAPVALNAAQDLGISPYSVMMAVAISASAAFMSPVGHPSNLLVMGPGGYRFSDYLKAGIPLTLVVFLVVLLILPLLWPLQPG